jgi:phosphoribosylformimino-5-aminoimidazole carboxamide ribotide isomerase
VQIYPAVDIKEGRVARGPTAFNADPVACAKQFLVDGASWIHVVDLDRAHGTGRDNAEAVREICGLAGVRVQVGGLLRSADAVRLTLSLGATRAVASGTMPLAECEELVREFGPARIALGIDVHRGTPSRPRGGDALQGDVEEAVERSRRLGIRTVIYRDLDSDGELQGADLEGAAGLVGRCGEVVLAGGVSSRAEIAAACRAGLAGVIVGRALIEGRFTLREALAWAQ